MKKFTLSNILILLFCIVLFNGSSFAQTQGKCMKIGMNTWFYAYWVYDFPFSDDSHKAAFNSGDGGWHPDIWKYFPKDSTGYPLQIPYDPPQDFPDVGAAKASKIILWEDPNQPLLPSGPGAGAEYVVLYDGDGELSFTWATKIKDPTLVAGGVNPILYYDAYGKRTGGRYVVERITGTTWNGGYMVIERSTLGNHVRNIRVILPGLESTYNKSDFVNPLYAARMAPFYVTRFMDWGGTNNSTLSKWVDRPKYNYESWGQNGIPYETMIKMSNAIKKHAWVCVPHLADDDYLDNMAKLWHDSLDSDLTVYLEYSNEIWNDGTQQAQYVKGLGQPGYGCVQTSQKILNMYKRWRTAWGKDSLRVQRVVSSGSSQIGWLTCAMNQMKPGDFDYISTTWYHASSGVSSGTNAQIQTAASADWKTQCTKLRGFATLAKQYNAKLCAYEGGEDIVEGGNPNGRLFENSPECVSLEGEVLDSLRQIGFDFINQYNFIGGNDPKGSYGLLEHLYQDPLTRPKYQTMVSNALPCYVVTITSDTIASGMAIRLDGSNDRVEANGIVMPAGFANDFTYEVWVRPDYTKLDQVVFSAANIVSGQQMNLRINYQNLVLFEIPGIVTLYSNIPVESGKWQHLAVSKLGGDYRLFINGVERGYLAASGSGSFGFNAFTLGAVTSNGTKYSSNFSGQLDEFKYWDTGISSISTIRNYMCQKTIALHPNYSNLKAYFRFDIVAGNTVSNRVSAADGFLKNFTNVEKPAYTQSGAPIGDQSVFIYNSNILSYVHPQGDQFSVIGGLPAQLIDGIHIYLTNSSPTGISIPSGFDSYSGARYYGVFFTNSSTDYNAYYRYPGNPGAIGPNESMRLLKRDDNSEKTWVNGVSFVDVASRTLKIECRENYRAEYVLGIRGASVSTKKTGAGNAVSLVGSSPQSIRIPVRLDKNFTITTWFKGVGKIFSLYNSFSGYTWMNAESGHFGGQSIAFNGCLKAGGWYPMPDGLPVNWNINSSCPDGDCPEQYYNNWNHVAYVYDRASQTLKTYINGQPACTGTINNFAQEQVWTMIELGGYGSSSGLFTGELDEFAVFNTTLNQTEIRDWMCKVMNKSHPKYCSNLVAYFNFDEEGNPTSFENPYGTGDALVYGGQAQMVRSGAKAGDVSVHNYINPTAPISLSHPDGDVFSVSGFSNPNPIKTVSGVHLYRVDGNMQPNTPLPGAFASYDSTRYWGVFIAPTVNTQWPDAISIINFNAIYNFAGNSSVAVPANMRLAARRDNATTALLTVLGTPIGSIASLSGMNMSTFSGSEFLLIGNSFQALKPLIPSTITGPSTVCAGQKGVVYQVDSVPNVTYVWRFPSGFSYASSHRTVTVDVGSGAVSGVISVTAVNVYGQSPAQILAVTVNNTINSDILLLGSQVCASANGTITVKNSQNAVIYNALLNNTLAGAVAIGTGGDLIITIPNANLSRLNQNVFVISATSGICNVAINNNPVITTEPLTGLAFQNITVCAATLGQSTMYNSELNVNYYVTNAAGTITLAGPFLGGGNIIITLAGSYLNTTGFNTFKINAVKAGCASVTMANDWLIHVKPGPLERTISAITPIVCTYGANNIVSLSVQSSEPGVVYYAVLGGVFPPQDVGQTPTTNQIITGDGSNMAMGFKINTYSTLPYGLQTWNVIATKDGCTVQMQDTANVYWLFRSADIIDGTWGFNNLQANGGTLCNVTTASTVRITSAQAGFLYQINVNGVAATGWHHTDVTGDQILFYDLDLTKFNPGSNTIKLYIEGCDGFRYLTQTATVTFSTSTGPNMGLAASDVLICKNDNGTISLSASQSGITYSLWLDQNNTKISNNYAGTGGTISMVLTGLGLNPGVYTTTIRAKDATCPAVDLTYHPVITVSSCPPIANFNVSPGVLCQSSGVTLTNLSIGTITGYAWSFGSGAVPATSSSSIPGMVIYSTTGIKTIGLTVTGLGGSTSYSQTVTVNSSPTMPVLGYGQSPYCSSFGSISLVTSSGITGGAFSVSGGLSINASSGQLLITTATGTGTYTITYLIPAAAGCNSISGIATVSILGVPILSSVTSSHISNCGLIDGRLTLSGTGGLEYSTNGSSWQSGNVFTGLSPISYQPQIRYPSYSDCSISGASITLTTPSAPVISNVIKTDLSSCGATDGTITINATGGTGILAYSLDGASWQSSNSFITLLIGSYQLQVRNQSSIACSVAGSTLTLTMPGAPMITGIPVSTPTTGCQSNDGTVTIQATGNGTLEYSLDGMAWQAATVFTNQAFGTYIPYVRTQGNASCTASGTAVNVMTVGVLSGTLAFGKNIYCSNNTNPISVPNPVYAGGIFIIKGGVFSNQSTGEVDLSGSLGNLSTQKVIVSYSAPGIGGCASITPTVTITINQLPVSQTIDYPNNNSYCSDYQELIIPVHYPSTITGTVLYSSAATGFKLNPDGVIDLKLSTATGQVLINYSVSVSGCGSVPSSPIGFTITPKPETPSVTYPEVVCVNMPISPRSSITGLSFTSTGLNVDEKGNAKTDVAGPYKINYYIPASGGCSQVDGFSNILVKESIAGNATLATSSPICEGNVAGMSLAGNEGLIQWQQFDNRLWINRTGSSDTASFTSGLLNSVSYFRAKVINTTETACPEAHSNVLTVTVTNLPQPGYTDSLSYTFCDNFNGEVTLKGYTGKIEWQEVNNKDNSYQMVQGNSSVNNETLQLAFSNYGQTRYLKAKVSTGDECPITFTGVVKAGTCIKSDFVPNALTPNSSDLNSVWDLSGMKLLDIAEVKVFNRYGTQVFSGSGKDMKYNPWRGGDLPAGTYYYTIDRKDKLSSVQTGAVTIIK
jgi:gliding motility-associated-like protein